MAVSSGKPLQIRGLEKTYHTRSGEAVEALCPMDMDIKAGEFVAVVGPSGCGKSTLLQLLAGIVEPTAGQAHADSALISGPSIDRSMVFQHYALFPWLTVRRNVEFGLERKRIPRAERREVADRYLKMVGLSAFADKETSELSGGMKQRVAIARAFAVDPSIILMDEPFGALDALSRRLLQRELLRIWQEHRKTVVFITHSVVEALFLADRVVVMTARPGRIRSDIRVDLPHPRDNTAPEFTELERDIYAQLDEELTRSFGLEEGG